MNDKEIKKESINNKRLVRSRSPDSKKLRVDDADHGNRLYEKEIELVQSRGDTRKTETGRIKKPTQKRRLQFSAVERGAADAKESGSERQKDKKTSELRKYSRRKNIYHVETEKKKTELRFENHQMETVSGWRMSEKAVTTSEAVARNSIDSEEDENAAIDGAGKAKSVMRGVSIRTRSRNRRKRFLRKQRRKKLIQREYAKAKREGQTGTAIIGTIEHIKKIGGKVTNFFKENRKVFIGAVVFFVLLLLIMGSVSSCSAMFMQNVITYTATSYLSSDDAINQAELYYTQLEANLQERINSIESEESGYEEYRYNIGPIEHDPFVLISYLSAKYEEFTFEQVKEDLDELFAEQYHLETEAVTETITETRTVRVGESLGLVLTSGYCNCSICTGQWAGGPTASGVLPTANHTIAVDAANPIVPMGTKIVMNGVEYTVEDNGNFSRYGVAFDVYYDDHTSALAHGHQTWEAYIADDNGSQEVEVSETRTVDVLNVTLQSNSLQVICNQRLGTFQRELFSAYNETKGNLQMFSSPFDFNWYGRISSYYGYRIHPISGENQIHNGLDIVVSEGTSVKAGLDGIVTTSAYNDSYGNYVIITDSQGYELRYAHLSQRSVAEGDAIASGDEIGKVGNTGNSTGAHLHMELLKNGERLNPIFYVESASGSLAGGGEYTSEGAGRLIEEAERHLGTPYVWGGYAPGGFDCSGFVSYCLNTSGVRNCGRLTAQGLYDICTPVSESEVQPGDLIFFTGTYNSGTPVSHVGIYVGNGQMIHCGDPIQYSSIYSPYWQAHFYAFGRW